MPRCQYKNSNSQDSVSSLEPNHPQQAEYCNRDESQEKGLSSGLYEYDWSH